MKHIRPWGKKQNFVQQKCRQRGWNRTGDKAGHEKNENKEKRGTQRDFQVRWKAGPDTAREGWGRSPKQQEAPISNQTGNAVLQKTAWNI